MAAALRGDVHPGRAREIGWGGVNLTGSGHASALRHLDGMPVLHWHGDVFELPLGAERLAWTEVTPDQAFAGGPNVLALQFHAEADAHHIESWLIGHAGELAREGLSPETLRQHSVRLGAQAAQAGQGMLRDWLRSPNT
jgi:GMP synthase (glutamine-hydrolysing)